MPPKLFVLGTFDQPVPALFDVDLMRCLSAAGVRPAAVVFKRSAAGANPGSPQTHRIDAERSAIHVPDFNAPAVVDCIRALAPDLLVYAGGRDLLRRPLLESARLGCLGGHYGRLPAIRGMGTVEWSVLTGEPPVVAIQKISTGIDTGDIVMQSKVPLRRDDTFTSIRERSYYLTKVMLALAARRVLVDRVSGSPQRAGAGRQYYRLHPALQRQADRALDRMLGRTTP